MCAHGFKEFSNGLVLKYWIETICLLLENYFQIPKMLTETFLQFSPLSLVKISSVLSSHWMQEKYPWRRRLKEHNLGSFQSSDLIVETFKKY